MAHGGEILSCVQPQSLAPHPGDDLPARLHSDAMKLPSESHDDDPSTINCTLTEYLGLDYDVVHDHDGEPQLRGRRWFPATGACYDSRGVESPPRGAGRKRKVFAVGGDFEVTCAITRWRERGLLKP